MNESNHGRESRLARLNAALRTASAQGLLISQAVADTVGLNTTDLECLDLIQLRGRVTAGELAKHTGLTTGAITGLIDRLERAGYVARENDPKDRRRVHVRVKPESIGRLLTIYEPLQEATTRLCGNYSAAELDLLIDFAEKSAEVAREFVRNLTSSKSRHKSRGSSD